MSEEEKKLQEAGLALRANYFIPQNQTKRAVIVLVLFLISLAGHIRSYLKEDSTKEVANQAQLAAVSAESKVSEIDLIKVELGKTNEKVKKYSEALESWTDFFQEEETRQRTAEARQRYKEQRIKIRNILRPVSKNNELFAYPLAPDRNTIIPMKGKPND